VVWLGEREKDTDSGKGNGLAKTTKDKMGKGRNPFGFERNEL